MPYDLTTNFASIQTQTLEQSIDLQWIRLFVRTMWLMAKLRQPSDSIIHLHLVEMMNNFKYRVKIQNKVENRCYKHAQFRANLQRKCDCCTRLNEMKTVKEGKSHSSFYRKISTKSTRLSIYCMCDTHVTKSFKLNLILLPRCLYTVRVHSHLCENWNGCFCCLVLFIVRLLVRSYTSSRVFVIISSH